MKNLETIFESMIKKQARVLLENIAEPMSSMAEECWVRGKKVNIDSIELDEGDGNNAKAIKAHYVDGTPLTKEELDELNNPGTSTGVSNVKQQPDLVNGTPATIVGEDEEKVHGLDDEGMMNIVEEIEKKYNDIHPTDWYHITEILHSRANLTETPQTAPVKTPAPTIPGTPTKPSRPHPLTPTKPGISPRPKAENTGDVNKFISKRQHFYTK